MASSESKIEQIAIAILEAALPTVEVRGAETNESAVSVVNRITVDVAPHTAKLGARVDSDTPKVKQSVVTVRAKTNGAATLFDSWRDAIDDAINPTSDTYPTAVVTLATSLLPLGIQFFPMDSGEVQNDDQMLLTRTFLAMYRD